MKIFQLRNPSPAIRLRFPNVAWVATGDAEIAEKAVQDACFALDPEWDFSAELLPLPDDFTPTLDMQSGQVEL